MLPYNRNTSAGRIDIKDPKLIINVPRGKLVLNSTWILADITYNTQLTSANFRGTCVINNF